VAVVVAVDQAGGDKVTPHIDGPTFGRRGAARPDVSYEAILDDDVDRAVRRPRILPDQRDATQQRLSQDTLLASAGVTNRFPLYIGLAPHRASHRMAGAANNIGGRGGGRPRREEPCSGFWRHLITAA